MKQLPPRVMLLHVLWGKIGSVRQTAIDKAPDAETLFQVGNRMFEESVRIMETAQAWEDSGPKGSNPPEESNP